jgi:hypothetical protein
MRYGLPTQEEINCWDDRQRAKGHEMVTVLDIEAKLEKLLEDHGCTLSVGREFHVGWAASGHCRHSGITRFAAYGTTRHEAIYQLYKRMRLGSPQ